MLWGRILLSSCHNSFPALLSYVHACLSASYCLASPSSWESLFFRHFGKNCQPLVLLAFLFLQYFPTRSWRGRGLSCFPSLKSFTPKSQINSASRPCALEIAEAVASSWLCWHLDLQRKNCRGGQRIIQALQRMDLKRSFSKDMSLVLGGYSASGSLSWGSRRWLHDSCYC